MTRAWLAQTQLNNPGHQQATPQPTGVEDKTLDTRHQIQRERLGLQQTLSEYYQLLLAEFERRVIQPSGHANALNRLLDESYQLLNRDGIPAAALHCENTLYFWCQFQTTIQQHCQLQKRLLTFPTTISEWHRERKRHPD